MRPFELVVFGPSQGSLLILWPAPLPTDPEATPGKFLEVSVCLYCPFDSWPQPHFSSWKYDPPPSLGPLDTICFSPLRLAHSYAGALSTHHHSFFSPFFTIVFLDPSRLRREPDRVPLPWLDVTGSRRCSLNFPRLFFSRLGPLVFLSFRRILLAIFLSNGFLSPRLLSLCGSDLSSCFLDRRLETLFCTLKCVFPFTPPGVRTTTSVPLAIFRGGLMWTSFGTSSTAPC